MQIGKNWKIESDEMKVTLYERKVSKSGKEYWREHSYYGSVESALKDLVNIEVNRTGLKDLQTVVRKIEELTQTLVGIATTCKEAS